MSSWLNSEATGLNRRRRRALSGKPSPSSWNWVPAFVLKPGRNESPSAMSTTISTWSFTIVPSLPLTGGSQDPAVQPSGRRANEFLPELFQAEDDGHGGQPSRRRHPLQRQRSNEGSIRDRRPG